MGWWLAGYVCERLISEFSLDYQLLPEWWVYIYIAIGDQM